MPGARRTETGPADELLMGRVQGDDREAFLELVRRHQAGVYGFLWRMCRHAHEAEDLAQESFLSVWRARTTWSERLPFRPWLYRIARNAFLQARRSTRAIEPRAVEAVTSGRSRQHRKGGSSWIVALSMCSLPGFWPSSWSADRPGRKGRPLRRGSRS